MKLTANPGIVSSMLAWSHTIVEINHEIIFSYSHPSADSVRVVTTESMYTKHRFTAKSKSK